MLAPVDIRLTGTGGPGGWPERDCPCASCSLAALDPRRPLALEVDGRAVPPVPGAVAPGVLLAGPQARVGTGTYALVLLPDADLALLAALRAAGAIGSETEVLAVGLTHRHRPDGLTDRLADCGVRLVPDGTLLHVPSRTSPLVPPRRTLVLGGARSGKSGEAERRLLGEPDVVYAATAAPRPDDREWCERVRLHQQRRPAGWETRETLHVAELLEADDPRPLLVDCFALWLTGAIDEADAWEDTSALRLVRDRVDRLVAAWRRTRRRVVGVSADVGSGVVPASSAGRLFRDELGRLNALLAAESERVVQVMAGRVIVL